MDLFAIYRELGLSEKVWNFGEQITAGLQERFQEIDAVAEYNQAKVLAAMQVAGSEPTTLLPPPDMAITTMAVSGWSRCMPRCFTPRPPWSVLRSPVVPML